MWNTLTLVKKKQQKKHQKKSIKKIKGICQKKALEDSKKYWEMGLAFTISQGAKTLRPRWDNLIPVKNHQIGLCNWKTRKAFDKLLKYQNNPCNIGKCDYNSTIFQGLKHPPESHASISVKKLQFSLWNWKTWKVFERS